MTNRRTTHKELWLGDFDKDGVPNIDDRHPFDKSKKGKVNPEVSLGKSFRRLEKRRKEYSRDIKVLSKKLKADDYRVKGQYSIIGIQIGKKVESLNDVGGLRFLEKDRKAVYKRIEEIKKKFPKCSIRKKGSCIKKVDDKIKKNRRENFKDPYMAVHLDINYKGKPYEIQVKCKRQQKLQDEMHQAWKDGDLKGVTRIRKRAIKLYKEGC